MKRDRFIKKGSMKYLISTILAVMLIVFLVITLMVSCFYLGDEIEKNNEMPSTKEGTGSELEADLTGQGEIQKKLIKIYIDKAVPINMWITINKKLGEIVSQYGDISIDMVFKRNEADIIFNIEPYHENKTAGESGRELSEPYYYVPVTSFFSSYENITYEQLSSAWRGLEEYSGDGMEYSSSFDLLTLDSEVVTLRKVLGFENTDSIKTVTSGELKEALAEKENTIAIIPFELIKPEFKVLSLDGKTVLDQGIDNMEYGLDLGISIIFSDNFGESVLKNQIEEEFYSYIFTNRKSEDLISIIMTGVTALTRQMAGVMDSEGNLYPAEQISGVLLDADITHISNEVSFVDDCFAAKPNTTVFCSKPEYMELIDFLDIDVIELTGNHINDYGAEWFEKTIDIYEEKGIPYFGGGKDLESSRKPALFNINGYKFAMLGANTAGPSYAWADMDSAGSAPLNTISEESKEKDIQEYEQLIKELKEKGYIVIFTFQYQEIYDYAPIEAQIMDFERISDAGAAIVSGSQSHQPQGVEIRDGKFINYGLGNLFFVQNYPEGHLLEKAVRQGIIAKHFFYRGRLINTVLITTVMDKGKWQPRVTSGEERKELLDLVFNGSIRKTNGE